MAKERCVKKSFQDSLEDIKERMKEKRTKKLAKAATVSKALSSKVKIINNSTTTVKSLQANNKALALALEAEKYKSRQAQDLGLHLKRELQRLMFEIFVLRRKLNTQGDNSSTEKLASLREIISKVTQNLLETANLLGPAHDLCSSNGNLTRTSSSTEMKRSTPAFEPPEALAEMCEPVSDVGHVLEAGSVPSRRRRQESSEKMTAGNPSSKARTSSSSQRISTLEKPELEAERENTVFKNVSIRRRGSNLNVCIEEASVVKSPGQNQNLHSRCDVFEELIPPDRCDEVVDMHPGQSPSKEDLISFANSCQISSSTPEPKPKQSRPLKGKTDSRAGREKVRKGKTEGQTHAQLKKPWEKSKPRTRSKSRERGASKPTVSKDKMNNSLNSGDTYDFACEESVHLTPFRQTKLGSDPEDKEPVNDQSTASDSSSGNEALNDSLYVPAKSKAKNRNVEKSMPSLPLRPRSKRNKNLQQQYDERTESKDREQDKPDVARGKKNRASGRSSLEAASKSSVADERTKGGQQDVFRPKCIKTEENSELNVEERVVRDDPFHSTDRNICDFEGGSAAHRICLSDVTNLCRSSRNTESKKHSFPFSDSDRKISEDPVRKRRCTELVNYAEPSLSRKLRRGDPFTNSEFLLSPIYKSNNPKRKSTNRKSLARYNEAFVGCR
ncbi:shugoshin 1 isoform X1 [Eleutherodactylus coqui]|uniref:shugoshin 1 isoform X1 n=1 Tax=Eleutherodactylus coqui TaxID=57060 RepID=UPI003463548D